MARMSPSDWYYQSNNISSLSTHELRQISYYIPDQLYEIRQTSYYAVIELHLSNLLTVLLMGRSHPILNPKLTSTNQMMTSIKWSNWFWKFCPCFITDSLSSAATRKSASAGGSAATAITASATIDGSECRQNDRDLAEFPRNCLQYNIVEFKHYKFKTI